MNAAGPGYETFPMEFDLNRTPTCQYIGHALLYVETREYTPVNSLLLQLKNINCLQSANDGSLPAKTRESSHFFRKNNTAVCMSDIHFYPLKHANTHP
jgi:hypothetical protein